MPVDPKSVLAVLGAHAVFFLFCRHVIFRRPITGLDVKIAGIYFLLVAALAHAAWLFIMGAS